MATELNSISSRLKQQALMVALVVAAIALTVAIVTNQAWEDYYITFRSSRNLAEGHGLVFQIGERVHTFTSPLGVLVPALGLWIGGNDAFALWFLRLLSVAALAATAVLMLRRQTHLNLAALFGLTFAVLDSKTLLFSTNGMETGLFVFFVALVWHELWSERQSGYFVLALGFAGLMWTRPDGILPALAMIAGSWLFSIREISPSVRKYWWKRVWLAALVGGLLYAPWFFGAWAYYGSPIPNTIMAKSVIPHASLSLSGILLAPLNSLIGPTMLDGLFGPIFFMPQDWPASFITVFRLLARVAAFAWLFPSVSRPARAASFATMLGGIYLQHIVVFSWYYAPWVFLGGNALGGVLQAILAVRGRIQAVARISAATLMTVTCGVIIAGVQTGRIQNRWIEENGRKSIGLWLHAHAEPHDTVFLEPLGYVGYFSGLKMYDYPGLSAPEVTRLVREGHRNYGKLIDALRPTWLILRPSDMISNQLEQSAVMRSYVMVQVWDQRAHLDETAFLPSRTAVDYDAVYLLYRKRAAASP